MKFFNPCFTSAIVTSNQNRFASFVREHQIEPNIAVRIIDYIVHSCCIYNIYRLFCTGLLLVLNFIKIFGIQIKHNIVTVLVTNENSDGRMFGIIIGDDDFIRNESRRTFQGFTDSITKIGFFILGFTVDI